MRTYSIWDVNSLSVFNVSQDKSCAGAFRLFMGLMTFLTLPCVGVHMLILLFVSKYATIYRSSRSCPIQVPSQHFFQYSSCLPGVAMRWPLCGVRDSFISTETCALILVLPQTSNCHIECLSVLSFENLDILQIVEFIGKSIRTSNIKCERLNARWTTLPLRLPH